jgi:hypothetical protein
MPKDNKFQGDGIGDKGEGSKIFPPELMRRRWSQKEIINLMCEDLKRNGKLRQQVIEIIKAGG